MADPRIVFLGFGNDALALPERIVEDADKGRLGAGEITKRARQLLEAARPQPSALF